MEMRKLTQSIGRILRRSGFSGKGQCWFFRGDGVVAVVALQKSKYGPILHVNVGFWLDALGQPPNPLPEHVCHVRERIEGLFQEKRSELVDLLNLESTILENDRLAGLERLFEDLVVPFLTRTASAPRLRDEILNGRFSEGLVWADAKDVLGIRRE
jgi:hypothetical protein